MHKRYEQIAGMISRIDQLFDEEWGLYEEIREAGWQGYEYFPEVCDAQAALLSKIKQEIESLCCKIADAAMDDDPFKVLCAKAHGCCSSRLIDDNYQLMLCIRQWFSYGHSDESWVCFGCRR